MPYEKYVADQEVTFHHYVAIGHKRTQKYAKELTQNRKNTNNTEREREKERDREREGLNGNKKNL